LKILNQIKEKTPDRSEKFHRRGNLIKPSSADEMIVVDRSQRGDNGSPRSRSQSPWWKNSAAE
jgi:hypothetical protein